MEDLLQSQIQDSCRLALPNGLKELMHDISREVLRAQPPDILKSITDYLSALLVTRDNLYIASKVCGVVYGCKCQPELEDELRYIGLDERTASDIAEIVAKFFGIGEVNEGSLLLKLVKKTSIDESQLPAVLKAIRVAFLRHQTKHTKIYESSSNSDDDETEKAVKHTLVLYRKTEPTIETYNCMAKNIQASYRAYKVRRESGTIRDIKTDQLSKTPSKSESIISTDQVKTSNHQMPSRTENEKSKVTFEALDNAHVRDHGSVSRGHLDINNDEEHLKYTGASKPRTSAKKVSSTSLAGSYLSLPQYCPYSAHDFETGLEETPEKERSNFDYTRENSPVEEIFVSDIKETEQKNKKIAFCGSLHEEDDSIEEMNEFYEEVEERILEDIGDDVGIDNVNLAEGMTKISEGKGLDAKDNIDNNKPKSTSTEFGEVDENIEGKHIVDGYHNSDIVANSKMKENVVEDILELDIVEELPEVGLVEEGIVEDITEDNIVEELNDDYILQND